MKHISYPKIQQFRNIVSTINREACFAGLDENGKAIYDPSIKKPILTFKGTVKLHGTNVSVCYNRNDGTWFQSRNNIIIPEDDNAGFAFFANNNLESWDDFMQIIITENNIDVGAFTISIYGEWAGKGIQKGVGISQIDKSFFIFGVKISKLNDESFDSYWVDHSSLKDKHHRIYNVNDFETFLVDVDFDMPQLAQNTFVEITGKVESECPISKAFGFDNSLGEGVVWTTEFNGGIHRFKVKGEKHSVTKVKKLASVDVEKLKSIKEFVDYAVTENRFNQAIENIFPDGELDIKKMGDYLRWVVKDVISEELDTLSSNDLEPKDVNKHLSHKAREMFFKAQKEF